MYVTILTLPNTLHIHCRCDFELAVASTIGIEIGILSVDILAMAMLLWTAHPGCPEHVKPELERHVRSLLSFFLLSPVADELFVNADVCQERLQGWALSQGFAIVRTNGNVKQVRPRFDFRCIHHGEDIANTCKLEKHIIKDEKNIVVSRRKQELININVHSCSYLVYLVYKQIGKRRSGKYDFILDISNDVHSHVMAMNPLRYRSEYIKILIGFLSAIELDKSLQTANISYSVALRMLKQIGFPLDHSTYYNIRFHTVFAKRNEFAGLVVVLEETDFIFEY